MQKKNKKTIIYLISGLLIIALIGTITYFSWSKSKGQTNSKIEIQYLQTELSLLKNKLNNLSDNTQKSQLKNQLSNLESQINKNPTSSSTIKKLEQELKKIKQQIESKDKPNENPNPTDKEGGEFIYFTLSNGYHIFKNASLGQPSQSQTTIKISENHPRIKKLLSEGKLQDGKQFTVRYEKVDKKSDSGRLFTFNENNQELEIIEVRNPSPQPDSKGFKFVSTKINDNTYKYKIALDVNGSEIDFANFIIFLKTRDKHFFQAFQGALKDANSKFPAYFWKCPPVSKKTLGKTFEFVVIKSDGLNNITQNYSSFQEHFGKSNDNQVVSFLGFSGSTLISPVPKGTADYKNISQFTKNAPDEQQQALWKEVVDSLMKELKKDSDTPRWLNTEGTGVWYLHVRIDKTSRFYSNYKEYEKFE